MRVVTLIKLEAYLKPLEAGPPGVIKCCICSCC